MKTAMQELIEKLSMKSGDSFYALAFYHDNDEIIKEALEKEKEQIIDAYEDGKENERESIINIYNYRIGEFYYNQTYNQNK
jgi:hypothetical protein